MGSIHSGSDAGNDYEEILGVGDAIKYYEDHFVNASDLGGLAKGLERDESNMHLAA